MANYSRSTFSKLDGKQEGIELGHLKKGRAEKVLVYQEKPIVNTLGKNDKYADNGLRRKEMNQERIVPPQNRNEIDNEDIGRGHAMKYRGGYGSNIPMKEPFPGAPLSSKNYGERNGYDENIIQDRSKFRRVGRYNEDGTSDGNPNYPDVGNPKQRNFIEYKNVPAKEIMMMKNQNQNQKSFGFSRKNMEAYENYEDYENMHTLNNNPYVKGGRNLKSVASPDMNDPIMEGGPAYMSRETKASKGISEGGGRNENLKGDQQLKDPSVHVENIEEREYMENRERVRSSGDIRNQKNKIAPKNAPSISPTISSTSPDSSNDKTLLHRKEISGGGAVPVGSKKVAFGIVQSKEDLGSEEDSQGGNVNKMKMYNNVGGRDMHYHHYPSKKGEGSLLAPEVNLLDKDGIRKKEYHNQSMSTIDSNFSNANFYEHSKTIAGGIDPSSNGNNIHMGDGKEGTYGIGIGDSKINKTNMTGIPTTTGGGRGVGGAPYNRDLRYNNDYEYEVRSKMGNKKYAGKVVDKAGNPMEKHRFQERVGSDNEYEKEKEKELIGKNNEYINKNERDSNASPEFGSDPLMNHIGGDNHPFEDRNESMIHNGRGIKINTQDYMKNHTKNYNNYNMKYEEMMMRKQNTETQKEEVDMELKYKGLVNFPKGNEGQDEKYHMYPYEDSYEMNQGIYGKDKNYYDNTYYNNKMNYKYMNERTMKRPYGDVPMSNKKKDKHMHSKNGSHLMNYTSDCYINDNEHDKNRSSYEYHDETYMNPSHSDNEKYEELRAYQNKIYENSSEKGTLTVVRIPSENNKQIKKKRETRLCKENNSLVDVYSTAIPVNEHLDSSALRAISQIKNVDRKLYALTPKSVIKVNEYDDITHVTLQSPAPLFVNPSINFKQHILTSNYGRNEDPDYSENSSSLLTMKEDGIKDSFEKGKEGMYSSENEKNVKPIIRSSSQRTKGGTSLNVKFKIGKDEEKEIEKSDQGAISHREKKEKSKSSGNVETEESGIAENIVELNKKIERNMPEEVKNLKIDRQLTEKRRASIFDTNESKLKTPNDKKKERNNKIVLDSNKVKKATEIKLKKIQHITGLLEKYDIPNPFEKYYMEPINYSKLEGLSSEAKLFNLALSISSNYSNFIKKSMDRAVLKGVFNEKRKKMIMKLIELLEIQINSEIKKRLAQANISEPTKKDQKSHEEISKSKISAKEKEIKLEEHNLMCTYWEKQSECMSLLIKEWNKICEILESINVDPNHIIPSLVAIYGEKAVHEYRLSADKIMTQHIQMDVNLDDISIANFCKDDDSTFDTSSVQIADLIQDIKWDMETEYSLNQIREDWKNQNKQNKKIIQKKIIEGIRHRVGLIDYLNKVEVNLNAFAKLIEGRLITNEDVLSQLRSMQDLNENINLANILEKVKNSKNELKAASFKTPSSFMASYHLPLTLGSSDDEGSKKENEEKNPDGNKEEKEKAEPDETEVIDLDGSSEKNDPIEDQNEDEDNIDL